MEKVIVLDVDYTVEEEKGIIRIWGKNERGESVLVLDKNFLPYFYVLPKTKRIKELIKKIKKVEPEKIKTKILEVKEVEKVWMGKKVKLIKIVFENPRKVGDVRDSIKDWDEVEETYEYDIPFYKRYILDKKIEPMNWINVEGEKLEVGKYKVKKVIDAKKVTPSANKKIIDFRILAFDTEFIEEDSKSKLIMLSVTCNDGFKKVFTTYDWKKKPSYVESLKNEKEIIEKFIEVIERKDVDFIVGYNTDGFDFPKLKEIAAEEKIRLLMGRSDEPLRVVRRGRVSSAKMKGRIHIDLFNFVDHILSPSLKSEVLTLDEVAQELIGVGKKEMGYKEMVKIWKEKNELERLVEYNLWDSELALKLAEMLLPQIFAISKLTAQLPFDASRYTYSQLVEAFYTRKAVEENILIPNRPKSEEMERRRLAPVYKGAIVIEPKKGIHSDILVFDFRSLYPTIIVSHNISPETLNCGHEECEKKNKVPELKWYFCTKKEGFIPKHLRELIEERKKIKDKMKKVKKNSLEYSQLYNMQYALKIIANATYGYFGFFGAKWYKRECGASAAAWGRYYITKVIEKAKEEKFEIIYGDTDSLMVRIPGILSKEKLLKMAKEFESKVNKELPGIIELEFRGLYEGGIFVARREGKVGAKKRYALIDYEGNLEIRGFETVRRDWCELSKRIQREVLNIILKEKDPVKAVNLVRDTIKKIKEGKVSIDDLVIFEQITRPLSQYEQIGPHVKAARKARERGRPVGEGSVIGFVIVKGSGSISDRAEPVEDVKPNEYDPEYYIHHQVLPAAMRVLKALGYSEQEVLSGKIQKSLEKFFKRG